MRHENKSDILRAIFILVVVAVAALLINWLRTPVALAAAKSGLITNARAGDIKGVNLIDDWSHKGWPGVARADGVESENDDDENDESETPEDEYAPPQVWIIDLVQAEMLLDEGECTFFDARETEYYEEGHIPGAMNWPVDDFDSHLSDMLEIVNAEDCVVVYCSGGACDESFHLGQNLLLEGFTEVYLYEGGIEEWGWADNPVNVGSEP